MEGLQIATASGDDQRPVVKLWDLRNSTSTPLAEFHEHSAGVLSLSWCPNDPGLLLSCGKDNRTLLWDLFSRKSLFEFPSENAAPSMGSDQFFGAGGGQRRFNVQWSPKIPAVASACTLDGKVQVWGLSGGGNPAVRPPKWYRRPVGASFGFGGKLVTIANPKEPAGPQSDRRRAVHFHRILSEPNLVVEAEELDRSLESKDFKGHCERKIVSATNDKEKSVWSFMQILFEQDARQHLLSHLGLDAKKINELNAKFKPVGEQAAKSDGTPGITEPTNPEAFLSESINVSNAHV
jgi:protein transport protein SEC31